MTVKVNFLYIGGGLQKARESAGLSQAELSRKSGVSLRTIQDYEQGRHDLNGAKFSTILKLCLALECPFDAILTDAETLELLEAYTEQN